MRKKEELHPCGCGLCNIEIEHLGVRRGRDTILEDVSFTARCGELTALIGVNGAGKTTLLKAILGEIQHTGSVIYATHDGQRLNRINIGYVPQKLDFDESSPVSVSDFLLAGRTNLPVWLFGRGRDREAIRQSLELCGAQGLERRTLGDLSGGELQRVMLAQALYPIPELLILDEPISGVDNVGSERFYHLIRELIDRTHMAVLMVSHDLELMRREADHVILLKRRVVCSGKPEEVFASAEYHAMFGGGTDA